MSAIVCGKRSSFFEDISSSSPPVSKRIRRNSSPVRFSPPRAASQSSSPSSFAYPPVLDHLSALFPDMDKQLLERALKECGNDLDLAIRSLNELRLGSGENLGSSMSNGEATLKENAQFQGPDLVNSNAEVPSTEDPSAEQNLSMGGADWVELFVREMTNASNMDDARARASRALEVLENSIRTRASAETAQSFQQVRAENNSLKEQLEALVHENTVLKRAVAIQHERQKEFEGRSEELHNLRQMIAQYQEQLRTLEVNNYALTMHLKQAQQNNSIPGRFNPDVF